MIMSTIETMWNIILLNDEYIGVCLPPILKHLKYFSGCIMTECVRFVTFFINFFEVRQSKQN